MKTGELYASTTGVTTGVRMIIGFEDGDAIFIALISQCFVCLRMPECWLKDFVRKGKLTKIA